VYSLSLDWPIEVLYTGLSSKLQEEMTEICVLGLLGRTSAG
jgi:hypothetical protein